MKTYFIQVIFFIMLPPWPDYGIKVRSYDSHSYGNHDITECCSKCVAYDSSKWFYASEIVFKYWSVLVGFMCALLLILIIIQCLPLRCHSSNNQKKCLSCDHFIQEPNFKVEDRDSESTKNLTLSSIVTKYWKIHDGSIILLMMI